SSESSRSSRRARVSTGATSPRRRATAATRCGQRPSHQPTVSGRRCSCRAAGRALAAAGERSWVEARWARAAAVRTRSGWSSARKGVSSLARPGCRSPAKRWRNPEARRRWARAKGSVSTVRRAPRARAAASRSPWPRARSAAAGARTLGSSWARSRRSRGCACSMTLRHSSASGAVCQEWRPRRKSSLMAVAMSRASQRALPAPGASGGASATERRMRSVVGALAENHRPDWTRVVRRAWTPCARFWASPEMMALTCCGTRVAGPEAVSRVFQVMCVWDPVVGATGVVEGGFDFGDRLGDFEELRDCGVDVAERLPSSEAVSALSGERVEDPGEEPRCGDEVEAIDDPKEELPDLIGGETLWQGSGEDACLAALDGESGHELLVAPTDETIPLRGNGSTATHPEFQRPPSCAWVPGVADVGAEDLVQGVDEGGVVSTSCGGRVEEV